MKIYYIILFMFNVFLCCIQGHYSENYKSLPESKNYNKYNKNGLLLKGRSFLINHKRNLLNENARKLQPVQYELRVKRHRRKDKKRCIENSSTNNGPSSEKNEKIEQAMALLKSFNKEEMAEWLKKVNQELKNNIDGDLDNFSKGELKTGEESSDIASLLDYSTNNTNLRYTKNAKDCTEDDNTKTKAGENAKTKAEEKDKETKDAKDAKGTKVAKVCAPTMDLHGELRLSEGSASDVVDKLGDKFAQDTLKKIVQDLSDLRTKTSRQDFPCHVNGSWSSRLAGVRIEVCPDFKGNLGINLTELTPPSKEKTLLNLEWKLHGLAPFSKIGLVVLAGVNENNKQIATFIGECRTCNNVEIISGQWLVSKGSRQCNDQIAAHEIYGDVWRRETLQKMRAEKLKNLLQNNKKVSKTTQINNNQAQNCSAEVTTSVPSVDDLTKPPDKYIL